MCICVRCVATTTAAATSPHTHTVRTVMTELCAATHNGGAYILCALCGADIDECGFKCTTHELAPRGDSPSTQPFTAVPHTRSDQCGAPHRRHPRPTPSSGVLRTASAPYFSPCKWKNCHTILRAGLWRTGRRAADKMNMSTHTVERRSEPPKWSWACVAASPLDMYCN